MKGGDLMPKHWKKYFMKIPATISDKIQLLKSNEIVIACVKSIPIEDIESGLYGHLNILKKNDTVSYHENIMPHPSHGRYSKYNLHGKVITLRHLPKVTKTYSADVPNFGDWSKGTHEITWDKKVFPKRHIQPKELSINITLLEHTDASYIFRFSLDTILTKDQPDFYEELFFHCNLLQENTGLCDVFQADASNEDYINTLYVGWELLPPGVRDVDIIERVFKNTKPSAKEISIIQERMEFFKSLDIQDLIFGQSKFNRYFGARFSNGYALLENIRYGNAIYIFKKDWQELSKLSRTELRRLNSDDIIWIPHTSNWKNNVKQAL
jgi:hypothetical protein